MGVQILGEQKEVNRQLTTQIREYTSNIATLESDRQMIGEAKLNVWFFIYLRIIMNHLDHAT